MKHCIKSKPFVLILLDNKTPHLLRYELIKHSHVDQFKGLLELIYNIYYGNISISPKLKKDLASHKQVLDKLVDNKRTLKSKQVLLARKYKLCLLLLKGINSWCEQ